MKTLTAQTFLTFLLGVLATFTIQANENLDDKKWASQAYVANNNTTFTDFDYRLIPKSLLDYQVPTFTFEGATVEANLWQQNDWDLALQLTPMLFNAKETNNDLFINFEQLDHFQLSSTVGFQTELGDFSIEPYINVAYLSDSYADYFSNLSFQESSMLNPELVGDSIIKGAVGVSVSTEEYFGGELRFDMQTVQFGNTNINNPITDGDSDYNIALTARWSF